MTNDRAERLAAMRKCIEKHIEESLNKPPPSKTEDESKTCLSYWYPIVKNNGVQTPDTFIIKLDWEESRTLFKIIDGEKTDIFDRLIHTIMYEMRKVSWGHLFLRTGQTSGKHYWEKSCFLETINTYMLAQHVANLISFSGMVDLPIDVWVGREMLPTIPLFYAFMGMPITIERRYFVLDGEVVEHYPYWPEYSIEGHINEEKYPNWRDTLREANRETTFEIELLTLLTKQAVKGMKGYWSIDWLFTENGWYCTDMAVGERSYNYGKDPKNKIVS